MQQIKTEKQINLADYAAVALAHKTGELEFVVEANSNWTCEAEIMLAAFSFGIATKSKNLAKLVEEFKAYLNDLASDTSGNA